MSRLTHAELFDATRFDGLDEDHNKAIKTFQSVLDNGKTTLAEYHLEGGSAAVLSRQQSWLIDQILVQSWHRFFPVHGSIDTKHPAPSLIAAGGYGRRELNLESDIDLLLLLPDRIQKSQLGTIESFIESFIRFCWDIGLKVGHSIGKISECVKFASKDLTVITNIMETRLIEGDQSLFEKLQSKLRAKRVWPADEYFKSKLQEQQARHLHFGDTAYNLEPNLKESPGGLRDLHMISWIANRYFGTSDFAELVEHDFLTDQEYQALIKGRNFLWTLRNGLHLLANRCEDRLLFDYQRDLAKQLGYKQQENHLAVEQMMKRYYRTVKELQLLNELLLQHFQEVLLHIKKPQTQKPRPRKINSRFNCVGNFLETSHAAVFEQQPNAILELFYLMQQHPKLIGIRASTIRQLRSNLQIIDSDYRKDPANQATFLNIFKYQKGLTNALRRMNAYGVLGAFFPEFGKVVGQMQHDLFHIFTVDAHSLFVVGNIRRLMLDKYKEEFPILTTILNQLNRRERLYLAALCHDIGKGSGSDHSVAGEKIALALCNRLDLSEYDAQLVAWLVRNHLIMSWTAQREDTSASRVIDRFAEIVGDQEHLDNLYLLTVADIRGTSHKVWNEWKGQLLFNLYTATSRRLRSGISGAQAIRQRIGDRKRAIRKLVGKSITEAALTQVWAQLDQEYFLRNGPETCAWHAQQIENARLLDLPLVATRYRPGIKARQILVVAPESDNLLPQSTAAVDKLGLSILDARIHKTKSGLALLVFVTVNQDEIAQTKKSLDFQTEEIRKFLLSPPAHYTPLSKNLPRAFKQFKVPTAVAFSDNQELGHTTMEIIAQDRPGLLYHVSIALLECKVRLISAKVSTVGEKAEDTFFIIDRDGKPVSSHEQRACLEKSLKNYLN
ncbi:[protein-PII] uridylyltransferase [Candidatus Spongiihabitans sp.]|uniref:[protein-PII] uridylyltransferase n=1 Tax=Candidatus Spongiihabitans sp. TaxID=3101308 RepID=UPI003C6FC0DF